jgi:farnesyl diphosphate synthase
MQYSVTGGGKRLRPLLAIAACEAVNRQPFESLSPMVREAALRAGCAIEFIHAYSLVHDDMPCMDNDVLRRGKPTVHVQFGEAQALLAGDALQAQAFDCLLSGDADIPASWRLGWVKRLAVAAGALGMAGGQAIDLASVGHTLDQPALERMHALKTGALLRAAVAMGGLCGAIQPAQEAALNVYGQKVGLAFQVVDDVLDVTVDTATLGKTAGKDAADNKPTFVALMGLAAAKTYANELIKDAVAALQDADLGDADALRALAHHVVARTH